MKHTCLAFFVATLLLASAVAQTGGSRPKATSAEPTPPPYCSPCLFYSGDFDPNNPSSNALGNGESLGAIVGRSAVSIPFVVPSGQTWTIHALFINELAAVQVLDPAKAPWSISTGVSSGQAGTVIASGLGSASLTPTGRSWNGLAEFTVMAQVKEFQLQSGKYWLSLIPQCTNHDDGSCSEVNYLATDVEDNPPANFVGSSPADDSFLTYAHAGYFFKPTWGRTGACGIHCDRFSAGVIGLARRAQH